MPKPTYNPLAMQRYRERKAALQQRVAQGELTPEQGQAQVAAFSHDLIRRVKARAKPLTIPPTDERTPP